jgi:hypothetical protein
MFFRKSSGHSALSLLTLSGRSSPISPRWHETPVAKGFHTRRGVAALQILLLIPDFLLVLVALASSMRQRLV